jgi:hypothetical protein
MNCGRKEAIAEDTLFTIRLADVFETPKKSPADINILPVA